MSSPEKWTHPGPDAAPATAAKPTAEQVIAGLRATDEGGADLVQLLTPEGERVQHPDFDIDITAEELRGLYRDMVLVRRFDREANALQRQGQLGIWVPLLGQEAAQIGAGRAMRPEDMAFPSYREHGIAWTRGVDPTELLGIFRGTDHGGWDPVETRFHPYTIVIGNQVLNATGYAMGQKFDGKVGDADGEATIVLLRRRRDQPGRRARGLRVGRASTTRRVVFFCQNNQWAISEPTERAVPRAAVPAGARLRLPRHPGRRQRRAGLPRRDPLGAGGVPPGNGPVLIEAFTYRMDAHTTSDDPTRYRLADEVEQWKLQGPDRAGQGAPGPAAAGRPGRSSSRSRPRPTQLADRVARATASTMPEPPPERIFANVYAEAQPSVLDAQRDEFLAYLAGFAGGEH